MRTRLLVLAFVALVTSVSGAFARGAPGPRARLQLRRARRRETPRPASTHAPATASLYRWDGTRWALDGQLPNLPQGLNVSWRGGWFVPVPRADPSTAAFRLVGACCKGTDSNDYESRSVLTNAGGTWHVEATR